MSIFCPQSLQPLPPPPKPRRTDQFDSACPNKPFLNQVPNNSSLRTSQYYQPNNGCKSNVNPSPDQQAILTIPNHLPTHNNLMEEHGPNQIAGLPNSSFNPRGAVVGLQQHYPLSIRNSTNSSWSPQSVMSVNQLQPDNFRIAQTQALPWPIPDSWSCPQGILSSLVSVLKEIKKQEPSVVSYLISSLMTSELPEEKPVQDSNIGLEFDSDKLKVRYDSLIAALYTDFPRQCTTCGLRFKTQEEHSSHMNWHVRQNMVAKKKIQKLKPSQKWFVSGTMWLTGAEAIAKIDNAANFLQGEDNPEETLVNGSHCDLRNCKECAMDSKNYNFKFWSCKL